MYLGNRLLRWLVIFFYFIINYAGKQNQFVLYYIMRTCFFTHHMHLFAIVNWVACSSLMGYLVHRYIVSISVRQRMLIAALVIKTACVNAQAEDHVLLWMSLIYLILFSMAIPVMYHSEIEKATLFHVIEAVVSLALVAAFAVLMYKVLIGNAVNLFYVIPVAIAVIGDTIIVAMRWKEKVNGFVLIFLIAASVMWIAGRIAAAVRLHG